MDEKINRRDFVKGAGLASAATVATLMATASTVSAEELVNPGGKAMDEMGNASIKRDLPESFYKRIENKAGYIGTTRVVAPTQRLDAREHGFSQIVRRGSTGDWSGEPGDWGPILLAAVQEKRNMQPRFLLWKRLIIPGVMLSRLPWTGGILPLNRAGINRHP